MNYKEYSDIFKVLSDRNRLKIIDILSCGELCACKILEYFNITQPTFAHHMEILKNANLVNCRRQGSFSYYTLNLERFDELKNIIESITTDNKKCICKEKKN